MTTVKISKLLKEAERRNIDLTGLPFPPHGRLKSYRINKDDDTEVELVIHLKDGNTVTMLDRQVRAKLLIRSVFEYD
jgi:hypothetical protein